VTYKNDLHEKDGAWIADATIAGGVDDLDNTHPLNCTEDGTLEVALDGQSGPIDVIVDNVLPVSQSGTWTIDVVNEPSTDAHITSVVVGTTSTQLLAPNALRKGIIIQCISSPLYVILGSTSATTTVYSYYVLKLNALEIENFFGTVSAVVSVETATVQVTEKI
jgi:hypothetical protein